VLKTPFFVAAPLIWGCLASTTTAQSPLTGLPVQLVTAAFDRNTPNSLKCSVEQWRPVLDFAFRFAAGYIVRCRLGIFEGQERILGVFARVTPAGKPPTLLGERAQIPQVDPRVAGGRNPSKLNSTLTLSGAFAVGVGDYLVEILAVDDRDRTVRKRWRLHVAANRPQRNVPLAIAPLTVEPLTGHASELAAASGKGKVRLTVLLDAAPINPYQSELHAWDRSFLLGSLYSLLREMPYRAVRLVAFNLEQQREIFRREGFDGAAFLNLAEALRSMETATISIQALKNRNSPVFLIDLVSRELADSESADAVVFLGPSSRPRDDPIGSDLLHTRNTGRPPFFYFEYSPWPEHPFPDALEQLTKSLDGKTYVIRSPQDLGQSIQKMLTQLKQK